MTPKILTIVGARPQFIKAATVSHALSSHGKMEEVLVCTGQHYDHEMAGIFFEELSMPSPAYNLGIQGGGHGEMTGRMMMALETAIEKESPRCVMVYGDTNSTLAGAIVAAKMNIPVAHVEAGLRSYNKRMPEEINRLVTDQLSGLLLCPTKASVLNLDREGITKGVHHVGDVMYDATLKVTEISLRRSDIHEKLGVTQGEYAVATLHRAENTDDPAKLTKFLSLLKEEARDCPIVFPVHPRTRKAIDRLNLDLNGLLACSPVGYIDMARLLNGARRVFTDSGGIQKEAYFHRVPCVTLRDETEWTETVDAGWNRLWNVDEYKPRREIDDYGEGDSSEKIVRLLAEFVT